MNTNTRTWIIIVILLLLIGAAFVFVGMRGTPAMQPGQSTATSTDDTSGLPNTYASSTAGFSIRYPADYTLGESYTYQEMGPGKDISGVKFTIPASLANGTNLGSDSYVSVEEIPNATTCSANAFLDLANGGKVQTINDAGVTYSVASTTGAGAGNRYEEWVYAIPGTNPCLTVRYFIHYSVFENYPAGTVTQFDEAALLAQFDMIRRTLSVTQ